MMEMLARFERGETEGGDGSGANGLEELLKGMGGLEGGMSEVVEEGAEEEGLEELEALIQRLGTGGDTGQQMPDAPAAHQLTSPIIRTCR
jgi:hypothetical protein